MTAKRMAMITEEEARFKKQEGYDLFPEKV